MTDRTKYQKITTYYQAFEVVLGIRLNAEIYNFLRQLEAEGHTEKSISYSIWRSQDKLIRFKSDSRFFGILKNEILKYSWAKGDPRWDAYWKKRNEEEKAKKIADELKKQQTAENRKAGIEKTKVTRYKNKYPGFVYFIQGENGGAIKIGFSKNPDSRLRELQTSYPDMLKILCLVPGSYKAEKEYHENFKDIRLNGEWFKPTKELLKEIEELKIKYPQQVGD